MVDRETAIAAWRRAEARIYPTVMVNAMLYEQNLAIVRAVVDSLTDITTEDDLVAAWQERRDVVAEVMSRTMPSMGPLMDRQAILDAAFCHRHRDITREQGKEIARRRLEEARVAGAEWVVLYEDVTPYGSHTLEMHVASGRAIHASSTLDMENPVPTYEIEVVPLDPQTGHWIVDAPPLMPAKRYRSVQEWQARITQAKATFGRTQ